MPDPRLAARLESLVAAERLEVCRIAQRLYPDAGVTCERIGDAIAVFGGSAIGVSSVSGIVGRNPLTSEELHALEAFLAKVGTRPVEIALPSDADMALVAQVTGLGLSALGPEDVLLVELSTAPEVAEASGNDVRVAESGQLDEWADLAARGFNEGHVPPECDVRFARCIARRAGVRSYWAHVEGRAVAVGELWLGDGIAWLSADATLPPYRGRGLQLALQQARLEEARAAGCTLAVTEAAPGSASHRNAGRLGFRRAYSRTVFSRGSF